MILIAAHEGDDHAGEVLGRLRSAEHPALVVDTAEYPMNTSLSLAYGGPGAAAGGRPQPTLTARGEPVPLDRVGAVWWRRPQPYVLDPSLDESAASWAFSECHEAISGLWSSLDAAYVNPLASDEVACHKPLQLHRAQELGLRVPHTLITNDPDAARGFVETVGLGRTVYKTFLATEANWRETRLVRAAELDLLDSVRLAPVIFQEFVDAAADLRVTVVGEQVHAAEIVPDPASYAVDYRMDMGRAHFAATTLPDEVVERLLLLMKRLDIVYGAIDLRRTPDGDYVFLEVNPAGEWLFVEERTGLPISAGMADLLISLDTEEHP